MNLCDSPYCYITLQICIAFAIHRGTVVIPKTVNTDRVSENLKSTEVKLDAEDMKRLRETDKNARLLRVMIQYNTLLASGPRHSVRLFSVPYRETYSSRTGRPKRSSGMWRKTRSLK